MVVESWKTSGEIPRRDAQARSIGACLVALDTPSGPSASSRAPFRSAVRAVRCGRKWGVTSSKKGCGRMAENDWADDSGATVPVALSLPSSDDAVQDQDRDAATSVVLSSSDSRQTAETDTTDRDARRGSLTFFPFPEGQRGSLRSVSETVRPPSPFAEAPDARRALQDSSGSINETQEGTSAAQSNRWLLAVSGDEDEPSGLDESASSVSDRSNDTRLVVEASDAKGAPPEPSRDTKVTQEGTTAAPSVKWLLAVSRNEDQPSGLDESASSGFDVTNDTGAPRHRKHDRKDGEGSIGRLAPIPTAESEDDDSTNTPSKSMTGTREGAFGGKVHTKWKVAPAGTDSVEGPSHFVTEALSLELHGNISLSGGEDSPLLRATRSGRPKAVAEALERLDAEETSRELENPRIVAQAAKGGNCHLFSLILDAMIGSLTMDQVPDVLSGAFTITCLDAHNFRDTAEESLLALTMLLQHGTRPLAKDLIFLSRVVSPDRLEECFSQAVACAKNCFIPSLHLTFALEDALREATERDRRVLAALQQGVEVLLSAVLKCLPQKVSCVSGGMAACAAVLEPELHDNRLTYAREGPLAMSLCCPHRIVSFATTPLCMNYLMLKFCRGLPALNDGARAQALDSSRLDVRDEAKGHESLTAMCRGSPMGVFLDRVGKALCGGGCLSLLTLFPGAHFIAVGVVTMPNSYFKVPAMRMALDAVVYVAALALFTKGVLLHDDGSLTVPEVAFAVYSVAAIASETELIYARNTREYFLDRWKIPQILALQMSLSAFVVRAIDSNSPWGRSLYAVASPLMYWRLLYYAQVLPSQGTTIQVLYSMASELGQFLVVMTVVLLGFSLSFFALFKEIKGATFRASLLDAFQAMLGEVGLFDDFIGTRHDLAATVLLVCYLVIMSIMLLNLLIAVLSTAHGKVEENVLIRVARARVYTYFRWVVENDMAPAPINVAQLAVYIPCRIFDLLLRKNICPSAMRGVARVGFWLVMGPLAILVGWLLWLASVPKSLSVIWGEKSSTSLASGVTRTALCFVWSMLGVPLCLVLCWVAQAPNVVLGHTYELEATQPPHPSELSVEKMLKEASGAGVESILARIKNPLTATVTNYCDDDADVQDSPVTLEHLRVLHQLVEGTIRERVEALESSLNEKLDQKFETLMAKLSTGVDRA